MSIRATLLVVSLLAGSISLAAQAPNTLTKQEVAAGWHLLWDGKTSAGWESERSGPFPGSGWELKDGLLSVTDTGGAEGGAAGDIITTTKYASFELSVDFRTTVGANSGILYLVDLNLKKGMGSPVGFEYQILDDAVHSDAKRGKDGDRTVASLYDMIPARSDKPIKPVGEWNTARIVLRGTHGEHWLNGQKVLEFDRNSPEFKQIVAGSKFSVYPNFGEMPETAIVLQDHGFPVSFRNIKIRVLRPSPR
ncbi:3-keto-disaccharide hydrolase [Granulicella arctica]|uniref:3-keto-disaccharide hydrolase n=1 Tax=Granulicella arctica TaxID=940613 RepID=UPI0021DF6F12|nr:DUF1080 domain-containing protein [Granulicella arctica]